MSNEIAPSDSAEFPAEADVAEIPQIDPAKARQVYEDLVSRQNLMLGIVGGFVMAIAGALIWAIVTVASGFQIGWMAIGVGFLVGMGVRYLGRGLTKSFGIAGAIFSLLGCLLGNILAVSAMTAQQFDEPMVEIVLSILSQPAIVGELLVATFSPMDLLFYGIAVMQGYRLSFREVTDEDLEKLMAA